MKLSRVLRSWWVWLAILAFGFFVLPSLLSSSSSYKSVSTSEVLTQIQAGNFTKAVQMDKEQVIELDLKTAVDGNSKISASYPTNAGPQILNDLTAAQQKNSDAQFNVKVTKTNPWWSLLIGLLPFVFIGALLFFLMSQMQGGGNRVMSFGRSKAKLVNKDMPKATFADVAGADEAIEELGEIKDFLQNPARYQALGAKIPKGVLLYGPPGTGKTLLARAVAGEANRPFYSISGSDFVEMFVGVGASRVRDLFEQAKTNAPAIIFVDEIDAVGRHRGAGLGGGHDEREQTLNQMLVEMDGFDANSGVIMIAATNRPDILDPALLRPGRFDRQIPVGPPDVQGREAVLRVHAKGKPFAPDVDLGVIARRTPGFTGADLANVINEAALLTARKNGRLITAAALEESIDRVVAGPERKTRAMSEKEKRVTAYHEAGHALAAWAMPNLDPVHKVTILPRGRSLGHTLVLPLEDRYTQTRSEILDQLVYALGGRAAEELVFHEPTTGASNDIEKATGLAKAMVTQYGMSGRLGAVKYGSGDAEPFMGRDYGHQRDFSEEIAAGIDEEVRGLIEAAHDEAWEILVQYRDVLDAMVLELVEKETLTHEDLDRIMEPVRKRPPHNTFSGFGKRTPSDRPPVDIPVSSGNGKHAEQAANGSRSANGAPGRPAPVGGGTGGHGSGAGSHGAAPQPYPPAPPAGGQGPGGQDPGPGEHGSGPGGGDAGPNGGSGGAGTQPTRPGAFGPPTPPPPASPYGGYPPPPSGPHGPSGA